MWLAILGGCTPGWIVADTVIEAPGADSGALFDDPSLAVNGVHAGGCCSGSADVYSLDRDGPRTHLVLAFSEPVVDGDGPDLVVFENPFEISGGGVFIDPVVVEVSVDGELFEAFGYEAPETYSSDPSAWSGLAGVTPGLYDADDPSTPDADLEEAGGDRFDLAELGLEEIRFVRLRVEASLPVDPISDGPDIDGVMGRPR